MTIEALQSPYGRDIYAHRETLLPMASTFRDFNEAELGFETHPREFRAVAKAGAFELTHLEAVQCLPEMTEKLRERMFWPNDADILANERFDSANGQVDRRLLHEMAPQIGWEISDLEIFNAEAAINNNYEEENR